MVTTRLINGAYFNPLPRKEGDLQRYPLFTIIFISIHSLVKRETKMSLRQSPRRADFNPLPRKEGDPFWISYSCPLNYFNPLPRKEGDWSQLF